MKRLATTITLFLTLGTTAIAEGQWTDVTQLFIENATFDNQSSGWTLSGTSGTMGPSAGCMRFYNGTCTVSQQLQNLPKGTYRLSVQGFYRAQADSYAAHNNGTEKITATLFAGNKASALVSVYSEGMRTQGTGSWQVYNGLYYPNNSYSANAAFEAGLYNNNVVEFEVEGTVTIGVRCTTSEGGNYGVIDNFRLEYNGDMSYGAPEPGALIVNEVMAANVDEFISPAFNFDGWLELYNTTDRPISLSGLRISDPTNGEGPWTMPRKAGIVPAKGYRVVWFDSHDQQPLNVPFKLDTDGGTIVISTADGTEIIRQNYPEAIERVSFARDKEGQWGDSATPTPGSGNEGVVASSTLLSAPVVDQPSQLFTGSLKVKVNIPEGAMLRYTTDGTLPTLTNGSTSANGEFSVTRTTCYRFRLYSAGNSTSDGTDSHTDKLPSRVTSRTYIYKDAQYSLPVIAVVTDPAFLYSREIGVMAIGPNGRPGNGRDDNCNWNMDWERPVNFSYLDATGRMVFNQDANLEMCGGWSRAWEPHAFKLKGNKELGGEKNLPYPFFTQKPYIRNRTLQIRNGGNDTNCRFRDPSLQYILQTAGINIDCQSYQPVHEFINGEYIGVMNMREPNNKHYVYANYGWDDDVIDQFEMSPDSGYVQKCGTADAFNELVDVLSPNAADADTYTEICRRLDIDAYINYMAVEMYLGNWDWPQNNVKGFRHRDGGRFRFVTFDIDGSFSVNDAKVSGAVPFESFFNKEDFWFDYLRPASLGRIHDRIRFVTLFKNLLKNAGFRRRFIDAYCIMGGSVYEKNRSAKILDMLFNRVEPAMKLPVPNRRPNGESAQSTYNSVKSNLNNRNNTATTLLKNYSAFNLRNTARQTVVLNSNADAARLYINGQEVPLGYFNGYLFAPVTLKAVAPAGYRFKNWTDGQGAVMATEAEVSLPSTSTVRWTANFEPLTDEQRKAEGITPVRINEVSGENDTFVDDYYKKGDWLELYNTTDAPIDVEGMYLSDNPEKPKKYLITKGDTKAQTVIPAHGHLVVWCDTKRKTTDRGLHAAFKIDGEGGTLLLTAADESWTDRIAYGAHDANTTISRYPDGTNSVYATNVATIGTANLMTSYATAEQQPGNDDVAVSTVSTDGDLHLCYASGRLIVSGKGSNEGVTVTVYRADGSTAWSVANFCGTSLNVGNLPSGFYVARATTDDGHTAVTSKFMIPK